MSVISASFKDLVEELVAYRKDIAENPDVLSLLWFENYSKNTLVSKWAGEYEKVNYQGMSYMPWQVMQKVLDLLDPNAVFEVMTNEHGGVIFKDSSTTSEYNNLFPINATERGIFESKKEDSTYVIKTRLVYFGKDYVDIYPVQDNAYKAVKNLNDTNAVNKAIQSSRRRIIALATGVGANMYMQYDDTEMESQFGSDGKKLGGPIVNKPVQAPKEVDANKVNEIKDTLDKAEEKPEVPVNIAESMMYIKEVETGQVYRIPKGDIIPDGYFQDPSKWENVHKRDWDQYEASKKVEELGVEMLTKDTSFIGEEVLEEKEEPILVRIAKTLHDNKEKPIFIQIIHSLNTVLQTQGKEPISFANSPEYNATILTILPDKEKFLAQLQQHV